MHKHVEMFCLRLFVFDVTYIRPETKLPFLRRIQQYACALTNKKLANRTLFKSKFLNSSATGPNVTNCPKKSSPMKNFRLSHDLCSSDRRNFLPRFGKVGNIIGGNLLEPTNRRFLFSFFNEKKNVYRTVNSSTLPSKIFLLYTSKSAGIILISMKAR